MRNRILLIGAILGIVALAYFTGLFQYLAPERMRELISAAGPWGPVVLVLLFTVLEPFGTPGVIFLLAAATLWPFWLALAVNWLGATSAGMFGFAFARYLGRAWVAERMPPRMREWDVRLSERGLPIVIGFRLLFFLNPASHWALGLSQVPVRTAILGTMIGFVPWVVAWTYFGAEILLWIEAQSVGTWIAVAIGIAAIIAYRKYRAAMSAVDTA